MCERVVSRPAQDFLSELARQLPVMLPFFPTLPRNLRLSSFVYSFPRLYLSFVHSANHGELLDNRGTRMRSAIIDGEKGGVVNVVFEGQRIPALVAPNNEDDNDSGEDDDDNEEDEYEDDDDDD